MKNKKIKLTKLPLTIEQVKKMIDKKGFIQVVFPFELGELMQPENEVQKLISEYVSGGDEFLDPMLEDISYRAVGIAKGNRIVMQVTGNVKKWLETMDLVAALSRS